eukprot:6213513-Pleurochrysis_carterae.AAC.3
MLLRAGAVPTRKNKLGETAAAIARKERHEQVNADEASPPRALLQLSVQRHAENILTICFHSLAFGDSHLFLNNVGLSRRVQC